MNGTTQITSKPVDNRSGSAPSIFRAFRRRRLVLILCVVLVPLVVVAISLTEAKSYTSTASLLFQNHAYAQGLFGTSATYTPPETDPTRAAATNLSLVEQSIIAQRTAQTIGSGLTRQDVQNDVSVTADGQSDLVKIAATTKSPAASQRLANTYADEFIRYRRQADTSQILDAEQQIARKLALLRGAARNTPAARELATRQQDLAIFASLQTGNAQVAEPAVMPTSPSSPRPVRDGIIGLFAGLLLGIAAVLILERIDRRVRDVDEFEQIMRRPLLGTIPRSPAFEAQRTHHLALGGRDLESFRTLRVYLRYFNGPRPIRTVMINSAVPGEGKSTVSWNLAAVAANAGQRVLLVEADMRRPVFAAWFGMSPDASGLSDFLAGTLSFEDVVRQVPTHLSAGGTNEEGAASLDVIIGGVIPPNPPDLLDLPRMEQLLSRDEYDLVVVDSPPAAVVSDAIHLLRLVDGVIVVVRLGRSRRDETQKYADRLALVDAPVLGVVVNVVRGTDGQYGYSYEGQYGQPQESKPGSNGHWTADHPRTGAGASHTGDVQNRH